MNWFRRNSRNRRSSRELRVLDVRLRSDQVRANRLRWATIGFVMLFSTLAGFFLIWRAGAWALDYFVYDNPAFAIQKIEVRTDGVIPAEQIRRWSDVKTGQNLLALDLPRVKRNLEMVSAIRSATVERLAPHTLKLSIVERVPMARLSVLIQKPDDKTEPGTMWLDEDGFLMSPGDCPGRAGASVIFPAVCGLNLSTIVRGKPVNTPGVRGALQFIQAFQVSAMANMTTLQQIDVSAPDILQVTTGSQGRVTFSLDNFDQQLRRWRDISDHARELGKKVITLDLSVPGNIPAVLGDMAQAAPVAAPPVKTTNPQPTRKRNV